METWVTVAQYSNLINLKTIGKSYLYYAKPFHIAPIFVTLHSHNEVVTDSPGNTVYLNNLHSVDSIVTKLLVNRNITILLTGLDYSGKTTIAKRLVGGNFFIKETYTRVNIPLYIEFTITEPVDSVLKTVGFSLVKLQHHKYNVNIYDLGGSYQIRGIWSKYYMDVSKANSQAPFSINIFVTKIVFFQAHGIIYVADASDIVRLHESKMVFAELLSHENISGKPILL